MDLPCSSSHWRTRTAVDPIPPPIARGAAFLFLLAEPTHMDSSLTLVPFLVHTLQDLKDYGRMGSESILWADVDRNGGDG